MACTKERNVMKFDLVTYVPSQSLYTFLFEREGVMKSRQNKNRRDNPLPFKCTKNFIV